jgi:hypothetical protein
MSIYQSVRRFVRKLQAGSSPEPRAIIETPPGEELQVDYGEGPMVRDPHTGKYKRTRLFVLTLGFSRKCVRLLVFRSSSQIWAELHEKAFRRLGGVTRIVVLDNLREGVLTSDIYDPALNPLYRDAGPLWNCRAAVPGIGSAKVNGSNGGIGRSPVIENSQVFPALFPVCSRSWLVLDNQNETREPGTLFIEREDRCLGDGG